MRLLKNSCYYLQFEDESLEGVIRLYPYGFLTKEEAIREANFIRDIDGFDFMVYDSNLNIIYSSVERHKAS